jgi:hypothetical protein
MEEETSNHIDRANLISEPSSFVKIITSKNFCFEYDKYEVPNFKAKKRQEI